MFGEKDPLHGVTLEMMLKRLVSYYGWAELGRLTNANCFLFEPTLKSSLKFLRKNQWARDHIEALYVGMPK